jgi:hypothetical protein
LVIALGTLSVALFAACSGADGTQLENRPPCPQDAGGCVSTSGGSTPGPDGGGEGGSGGASSSDVHGDVGVLNDPTFMQIAAYAGAATIIGTGANGMSVQAPYGNGNSTFTLKNLPAGQSWVLVRDETVGAGGIFSTYSAVQVPAAGDVMLPVIDRQLLTSIAGTLPVAATVQPDKAHLVIELVRSKLPLSGVSLSTQLPGAVIAYDTGPGLYSNTTKQTSSEGTILVFNLDAPTNGEILTLTLSDVAGQSYTIQLPIRAATATLGAFNL